MRYWAFLFGKVLLAGSFLYGVKCLLVRYLPPPQRFSYAPPDPWHDLGDTFIMLLYSLLAAGVFWLVIWDQRYRCRTCLRRLRMPVLKGSWTHVLFGPPHTEYICLYGHGTLTVAELQITGRQNPDWAPHEDIWKELYSLEESNK